MIMCTHLQIVAAVVPAVENFLSECARSVATTDVSLRDYFCLRLDSIIMNLEELMQCVGTNCQLQHLREQARMYHNRFERFSIHVYLLSMVSATFAPNQWCPLMHLMLRFSLIVQVDQCCVLMLTKWKCYDKLAIRGKRLLTLLVLAALLFGGACESRMLHCHPILILVMMNLMS